MQPQVSGGSEAAAFSDAKTSSKSGNHAEKDLAVLKSIGPSQPSLNAAGEDSMVVDSFPSAIAKEGARKDDNDDESKQSEGDDLRVSPLLLFSFSFP
jgi:hypothetical protein